jgi:hypothetical protein
MKQKLHAKARKIAQSPATKKALIAMKPEKSVWGFLGIVLFLIVPEIIAFIYGVEITAYAKEALLHAGAVEKYYFDFLVMMFEEGGSWVNLAIAAALLVWFFF